MDDNYHSKKNNSANRVLVLFRIVITVIRHQL